MLIFSELSAVDDENEEEVELLTQDEGKLWYACLLVAIFSILYSIFNTLYSIFKIGSLMFKTPHSVFNTLFIHCSMSYI